MPANAWLDTSCVAEALLGAVHRALSIGYLLPANAGLDAKLCKFFHRSWASRCAFSSCVSGQTLGIFVGFVTP